MAIIYVLICIATIYAIATDVIFRRIYNLIPFLIIILSFMLCFIYDFQISWGISSAALAVGFLLFSLNIWGAGDAKLCFALLLSVPDEMIFYFFFIMSICGGVIAILMVIFPSLKGKYVTVPYGLAIGIAYLITIMTGILNGQNFFS